MEIISKKHSILFAADPKYFTLDKNPKKKFDEMNIFSVKLRGSFNNWKEGITMN